MKEFLLVFRGGEAESRLQSPDEQKAHMQRWQAWVAEIAKKNQFISGQPLKAEGKVITSPKKKLTDGPYAEGKELVGGYLLIKATDIDEAVKISETCPVLRWQQGSVEVREIGYM